MKYWLFSLIGLGVFLFFFLRWLAPSFIFHPSRSLQSSPQEFGLAYDDIRLQTSDGETIAGWFIPAVGDADEKGVAFNQEERVVLFFHGNAGNISHRIASIAFFHELGLSVFIIDYRGYGESTGKPSVEGTLEDARAAWRWLREDKGLSPSQIVVFGRSLGGGVAANFVGSLPAEEMPSALIMESTFTSLHAVGKRMFPGLPRWVFVKDYESLQVLSGLDMPLLVVHSPEDEVIPYTMGRELFEAYSGPRQFIEINGSHNAGWFENFTVYEQGMREFLATI